MDLTPAAVALGRYLESAGKRPADLARACDVSRPTVHNWLRGAIRPREHHREIIEAWTEGAIPVEGWRLEEETAAVERARARQAPSTPPSQTETSAAPEPPAERSAA